MQAPAKFRGRTIHHQSTERPPSSPKRPAGRVAVITKNPLIMAAIGALASRKEHHSLNSCRGAARFMACGADGIASPLPDFCLSSSPGPS